MYNQTDAGITRLPAGIVGYFPCSTHIRNTPSWVRQTLLILCRGRWAPLPENQGCACPKSGSKPSGSRCGRGNSAGSGPFPCRGDSRGHPSPRGPATGPSLSSSVIRPSPGSAGPVGAGSRLPPPTSACGTSRSPFAQPVGGTLLPAGSLGISDRGARAAASQKLWNNATAQLCA